MRGMEELMRQFIDYAKFNEDGDLTGIQSNAPEEAKKAYDEFIRIQKRAFGDGVKI